MRDALDGGRAVLVSGPAGIGKTTVVRAALSDRPQATGTSLDSLRWKRYLPLSLALQEDLTGEPEAVASAVTRLLHGRTLFIDDLHWSDDGTRAVLDMLAGKVPLIATTRVGPLDPPIVWEHGAGFVVEALDASASRDLARKLHPGLDDDGIERLLVSAGGNPLLLEQLVDHRHTTTSLRAAAAARLRAMPPNVRDLVSELALLGRPVPLALFEVDQPDLPPGFVVRGPHDVALVHALLADAAIESLDAPSRRAAHLRLAGRLTGHEAAEHYLAAGEREAAADAARRSLETASDPAARARALSIAADATGDVRLRLDTAAALVSVGDWAGAVQAADHVVTDDPLLAAEALFHAGRARWFSADVDGARESIERGQALVGGSDAPIAVRLLIERAHQRVRTEHAGRTTTPIAEEALMAAVAAGIDVPRARLVHATALAHDDREGWEDAYRLVIGSADESGDAESECAAAFFLASHYGLRGRTRDAITLLDTSIERAGDLGQYTWQTHMRGAALTDRFWAGADPAALADDCRQFIDEQPMFRNRAQIELIMALARADARTVDEARDGLRSAARMLTSDDDQSMLIAAAADIAWLSGEPAVCLAEADRGLALGAGYFGVGVATVAAAAYVEFEAGRAVTVQTPDVAAMPVFAIFGDEVDALRLAATDAGAAIAALDAVASRWEAVGTVRFELRARWAAAVVAQRQRHPSARRRLTAAHDGAVAGGLWWIRRRALDALARLDGARALSAREAAVLQLVGTGLTSKAIAEQLGITPMTVETHIRAALGKLGATTRRQAVAIRSQHGAD